VGVGLKLAYLDDRTVILRLKQGNQHLIMENTDTMEVMDHDHPMGRWN
jgi:hypothetical protein